MDTWCDALLNWYHHAKREMPWRGHSDAYAVWVSEIMLQQTQVDTVRPYFQRFLYTFPTIAALAAAEDDALLKAWEGLGYYTRVRNLRKAAQVVMQDHHGVLPRSAAVLKTLPGIGNYTAAAIASICFKETIPVVDGNVARVFARRNRLTADFTKEPNRRTLAAWLQPFIECTPSPGDFNQAMMELGALVCTPRNPQCDICPLRPQCAAAAEGTQTDYPIVPQRKALPERTADVILLWNDTGALLLKRHDDKRLLAGFWELPDIATLPFPITSPRPCGVHRQTFSHFRQVLTLFTATCPKNVPTLPENYCWCTDPNKLPLTTATRKILKIQQVKKTKTRSKPSNK